jgi:hypothetical protein
VAAIKERLRYFKERFACFLRSTSRQPGFVAHIAKVGKLEEWYGCNPKALDAAAQYFDLDATSAEDRELLAYILADVVFGRQRGRPRASKTAWDNNRLLQLFIAYEQCKRANPALSDSAIAKQIGKTREFSKNDPEQIRQQLYAARGAKKWADRVVQSIHDNVRALEAQAKRNPESFLKYLDSLKEVHGELGDYLERVKQAKQVV